MSIVLFKDGPVLQLYLSGWISGCRSWTARNPQDEFGNGKPVNNRQSSIPIIALIASIMEDRRATVLSAHCDDFVRKPYRENEIVELMAQHFGVRFIYQELKEPVEKTVKLPDLTSADLADLPTDLVQRINSAAKGAMSKQLLALLEQIPPDLRHVADALAEMVQNYQFSKIIALTDNGDVGMKT